MGQKSLNVMKCYNWLSHAHQEIMCLKGKAWLLPVFRSAGAHLWHVKFLTVTNPILSHADTLIVSEIRSKSKLLQWHKKR